MPYTIYLRTNLVNGKQYVGQTKNFKQRQYNWYNTNWEYAGKYINHARGKYGTDSFDFSILKECENIEETNFWEQYYIELLNTKVPNGYNLTDGGEGSIGYIVSDETRKKISESVKGEKNGFFGKHHSEETKEKISKANKGRTHTNEAKEKMKGRNSPMKGKHHSDETKKKLSGNRKGKHYPKLSEALKGKKPWNLGISHSEETIEKLRKVNTKKVYQYEKDGTLIKIWESARECGRNGFCQPRVSACCRGDYGCKTYKGYIWSYAPL